MRLSRGLKRRRETEHVSTASMRPVSPTLSVSNRLVRGHRPLGILDDTVICRRPGDNRGAS